VPTSLPHVVVDADGRGPYELQFKIRNVGDARAPRSQASVLIDGRDTYCCAPVGPIAPGGARIVHHAYTLDAGRGDWGNHLLQVCSELDSCSARLAFAVVPHQWNAVEFKATTVSAAGGPNFATNTPGMYFDYYGVVNENGTGTYYLWLAHGSVHEIESGSVPTFTGTGTCTYSGEGNIPHAPWDLLSPFIGYLEIDTSLSSYHAEVLDEEYRYTSTMDCGSLVITSPGGIQKVETYGSGGSAWADTALGLEGTYHIDTEIPLGHNDYSWKFLPDVP
jgi:hypothetical protein